MQSLDIAIEELEELKSCLGAEITSELQVKYSAAGGEQFLQDPNRLRCTYTIYAHMNTSLILVLVP